MIERKWIDKSDWKRGEWDHEPDKVQWTNQDTGLTCLIVRGPAGALCGYVGVPEGHPWYQQEPDLTIVCHGGITFSGFCREDPEAPEHGICHVGEDKPWWIGFDCAHCGDATPGISYQPTGYFSRYKNLEYVKNECKNIALQIKEASK